MIEVRDKKKAYLTAVYEVDEIVGWDVRNWKGEYLGEVKFNDDWSLWCFYPNRDTFFGPEFLKSLASQMEDIQTEDEKGWE